MLGHSDIVATFLVMLVTFNTEVYKKSVTNITILTPTQDVYKHPTSVTNIDETMRR